MAPAGGTQITPAGKSFAVDLRTVARRDDGQIAEENLFYDVADMTRQLGLST